MADDLDALVGEILKSYEELGGINHLEGPNLPSRRSITRLVDDFVALMFPGYHADEAVESMNLKYMVGERLTRMCKALTAEVGKSLAYRLRTEKRPATEVRETALRLVHEIIASVPAIRRRLKLDVEAAFEGDPAAKTHEEVILSYPCILAILVYRVAHEFQVRDVPLIPRMMSEHAHRLTGIDIHPGADIGEYFFIDHGTGVVIGETTVIGNHVKLYQGVTLGALSVHKSEGEKKRHPTIEDNVTIYAHATILGGNTVIGRGSVIGGNVWIVESVPADSRIYYEAPNYVTRKKN